MSTVIPMLQSEEGNPSVAFKFMISWAKSTSSQSVAHILGKRDPSDWEYQLAYFTNSSLEFFYRELCD